MPEQPAIRDESTSTVAEIESEPNRVRRWLKVLGPGLVTGASDDDPSGIATYSVAGASLGYTPLWLSIFTLPMMASVQFMAAKIGMVTGVGLAGAIRSYYSRNILFPLVLLVAVANLINVGADIGAVAAALNLILPLPIKVFIVPVAVIVLLLQVFGSYRLIAGVFRWLTFCLFAYIATVFFASPDLGKTLHATFIPTISFDSRYLATLVAILGTTISPYLWFWQSSQEVDEERAHGRRSLGQRVGASSKELEYKAFDVDTGMLLSNAVMYFIILTTAATLHQAGQTDIKSATDAAQALKPLAGDGAKYLLATGLIGAGLLAIPVLSGSAGYAVAEAMGWRSSLDDKPREGRRLYGVIAAATLIGMLINFAGINPIDALFYAAVLNGLVAPPVLVVVMLLSNNRKALENRTNGPWTNVFGWLTTAAMTLAAVALVVLWATGSA